MPTPALMIDKSRGWNTLSTAVLLALSLLAGCSSKDGGSTSTTQDSGAGLASGVREETFQDRFGKSVTLPIAVPGEGSSPEKKLHGHWIWFSDAFIDDKTGQKMVNGPWAMEEAHSLYINSKDGKKKIVEIWDSGSIEEYSFSVVSQNAKTGVIKIEQWYAKDDEKPVRDRGAAKREYTLKDDGTMSYEQNFFGTIHTVTLRRIGDETTP